MTHAEAYKDHSFLFGIGPASDMTGGYVDSNDLDSLLKDPSKKNATRILERQIWYWFEVGTEDCGDNAKKIPSELVEEFPEIEALAEKYCCDIK